MKSTYNVPILTGKGDIIFSSGDGYYKDTASLSYYTGFQRGNGKGYMKFYQCGRGDANPNINFNHNLII